MNLAEVTLATSAPGASGSRRDRASAEAMKGYAQRYSLDGRSDKVCLVVADIRHQGRGRSSQILSALSTGGDDEKAFKNPLEIGKELYAGRVATLKAEIGKQATAGITGKRKYSAQQSDFVLA